MSSNPRLRGRGPLHRGPWPLGQIPDDVLRNIGRWLVHRMAVGVGDLDGDDFGNVFADAIHGDHASSPVGIGDVAWNGCGWSLKTVKRARPFTVPNVRLISGRNNIEYSLGIDNRITDPEAAGRAVLSIWNSRINQAMGEYDDLRIVVLVRNWQTREFLIFEEEAQRFAPDNYTWRVNNQPGRNLEGYEVSTGVHRFTWQRNGAQFTIIRDVPASARKFVIDRHVPLIEPNTVLSHIEYDPTWIEVVG